MADSKSNGNLNDLTITAGIEYVGDGEGGKTELGRGAYGVVYNVKYGGIPCAAKEIHQIFLQGITPQEKACIVNSFIEECKRCSSLSYPKIVRFLGVFYPRGQSDIPVMVMEMMDTSLTSYLKKPPSQVHLMIKATVLLDVGRGLCYLHSQKPPIIHRDLSPNNILLKFVSKCTEGNDILVAKIADLGVAKVIQFDKKTTHSKLNKMPGTADFMPPEAMTKNPVYGTSMDVFSYGGIMLFVVTHEWPTPSELAKMDHKAKTLVVFTEVERRINYLDKFTGESKALKPLVKSLLNNDPAERPTMKDTCKQIEIWNQVCCQASIAKRTRFSCSNLDQKDKPDTTIAVPKKFAKIASKKKSVTEFMKKSPVTNSYSTHPWYVGRLSISKAESRFKNLHDGVYLVREDDRKSEEFAICIKWKQKIHHIQIVVSQMMKYSISELIEFTTIYDLVEYYQKQSLHLPHLDTVLKYAYYMVCTPPKTSLQLPWSVLCGGSAKLTSTQIDAMFTSSDGLHRKVSSRVEPRRNSEMIQSIQLSTKGYGKVTVIDDEPPEVPLEEQPWYHGEISRANATQLLKNNGDYLVRYSKKQHSFILTVMCKGVVKSFIIHKDLNNQVSFLIGPVFSSISKLLSHYVDNNILLYDLGDFLRKAVCKPPTDHHKHLINQDNLIVDDVPCSQETFNIIYSATMKTTGKRALMKTGDFVYASDRQRFLSEAKLLQRLSHPNIVKILFTCTDAEPMYMVLEMMSGGGFLTFLCTHSIHQTQYQLTKFSLDAALGMEYLASQNCLHRNLAARSCLVGNNNQVLKISDFSMCKQTEKGLYIENDEIHGTLVRWTAPETLSLGICTTASDVWSYGVLLYEIYTCGKIPYFGMSNNVWRKSLITYSKVTG
ncbi:uncharacterized protein [Dysidea avara]|uniref:uncharacterized protein isoform X2 n=1 Tax=Dysidea avara TaxID=196820 RepID=UPI0033173702